MCNMLCQYWIHGSSPSKNAQCILHIIYSYVKEYFLIQGIFIERGGFGQMRKCVLS